MITNFGTDQILREKVEQMGETILILKTQITQQKELIDKQNELINSVKEKEYYYKEYLHDLSLKLGLKLELGVENEIT